MKSSIFLTIISILFSAGILAQDNNQTQLQTQNKTQAQTQTRTQSQSRNQTLSRAQLPNQDYNRIQNKTLTRNQTARQDGNQTKFQIRNEAAGHGQTVSSTAINTESGTGKGEIVSKQAKSQCEIQKAREPEMTPAMNQSAAKNNDARSSSMQRNTIRISNVPGSLR